MLSFLRYEFDCAFVATVLQAAAQKVQEVRDITRIERIG